MKVKEAEYFTKAGRVFHANKIESIQYRILQNLWERILKRSYKHRTSFICLKLEELELSWSGVRYLLRVLRMLKYFNQYEDVTIEHHLQLMQNARLQFLPEKQSPYCLITSGQVQYPSNK
jgi:hypothetical protein